MPYSGSPTRVDQSSTGSIIVTASASASGPLLLLIVILFCICIFKQRSTRRMGAAKVIKTDENATYGDYSDPDYRMEVEDNNDYYSSDYEAWTGTSRTTDNNSYYEY